MFVRILLDYLFDLLVFEQMYIHDLNKTLYVDPIKQLSLHTVGSRFNIVSVIKISSMFVNYLTMKGMT